MRRVLALIPALALVVALAPASHANPPGDPNQINPCLGHADLPNTFVTGTTKRDDTGTLTTRNMPIYLLRALTISNPCHVWARAVLENKDDAQPTFSVFIWVAPGVTRTLGKGPLTKLGLWHYQFVTWYVRAPAGATAECGTDPNAGDTASESFNYVLANGKVTTDTQPCPPPV